MNGNCWILLSFLAPAAAAQDSFFTSAGAAAIVEPLPGAYSLAIGDVTGDGKPDVLVGSRGGVVLFATGSNFPANPGKLIPTGCDRQSLAVADFDRDGLADLAVYCWATGVVSIHRGDGTGAFGAPARTTLKGGNARGLVAADFNVDGIPDLAVPQTGGVAVLVGAGDGSFRPPEMLAIPLAMGDEATPTAIVSADFDGNGIPDLATADPVFPDDASVFLGTGEGKFKPEIRVDVRGRPFDLAAADFDRNGVMDLAVADQSGLVLLAGNGDGSFREVAPVDTRMRSLSVAAADLNGDGLPDFAVGNYYEGRISVLINRGDGKIEEVTPVQSVGDVYSVSLPDLNGDGLADLFAASYSGSSAVYATGRGDGSFDAAIYFGAAPANSLSLRGSAARLAVLAERRRSITVLSRGRPAAPMAADGYPLDAQFADFDRDGVIDMAAVAVRAWTDSPGKDRGASIQFLRGRADGSFERAAITPVESCPVRQGVSYGALQGLLTLATGDFTGDRIPDLILRNDPLAEIQVYTGKGDGTFQPSQSMPVTTGLVLAGEFTGDGIQDLVVAARGYGYPAKVTLYAGAAGGPLGEYGAYEVCPAQQGSLTTLVSVQEGDFDGDGRRDLAFQCYSGIDVLRNTGAGFERVEAAVYDMTSTRGSTLWAVADFDGDGKDDLAGVEAVYDPGNPAAGPALRLTLRSGGTGGALKAPLRMPISAGAAALTAWDFDGDGRPDIAFSDAGDGEVKLLLNRVASR